MLPGLGWGLLGARTPTPSTHAVPHSPEEIPGQHDEIMASKLGARDKSLMLRNNSFLLKVKKVVDKYTVQLLSTEAVKHTILQQRYLSFDQCRRVSFTITCTDYLAMTTDNVFKFNYSASLFHWTESAKSKICCQKSQNRL